jgi:hypothetical protein
MRKTRVDYGITASRPAGFPALREFLALCPRKSLRNGNRLVAFEVHRLSIAWSVVVELPFTRDEFLDLFADYNLALWPAVATLWVASVLICAGLLLSRRPLHRWVSGLLVVHWAWAAVAYHLAFFTRINPAAWLFAAMFLVQAGLFVWFGVIRNQLSFTSRRTTWSPIAWILMAYGLVYPAINAVQHDGFLRSPTFGLPCPTTILTGGLLLLASPHVWTLAIVPALWSVIGGSAAVLLGVSADYALPVTGLVLALFEWHKSQLSPSGAAAYASWSRT